MRNRSRIPNSRFAHAQESDAAADADFARFLLLSTNLRRSVLRRKYVRLKWQGRNAKLSRELNLVVEETQRHWKNQVIVETTVKMLSRRIATARPLRAAFPIVRRQAPAVAFSQQRCLRAQAEAEAEGETAYPKLTDAEDPGMNGGYANPPPVKRQFRDPYGDWWDKQERRNYGEPVHEDNDILGIFSTEEYTHTKPGKGLFQIGCFVAAVFGLCGVVSMTYPDKQSAPREFEGGLERELGGPGALRARAPGDE